MAFAEERKAKILSILDEQGSISTNDLIELLDTSRETIRRDLNEMAQKGQLIKTHGGAVAVDTSPAWYGIPISKRESLNLGAKKSICAQAAASIQDKDLIFVDNSSTVLPMIDYIPKDLNITIITNSIKFLIDASQHTDTNWKLISLGGVFSTRSFSTADMLTLDNLSCFRPSKAFVSAYGIDTAFKITDSHIEDIDIKRAAMRSARDVFLLVDHSKLKRNGTLCYGDANKCTEIITDYKANSSFVHELREKGCSVVVAPAIL